jgi:hypothetical protein
MSRLYIRAVTEQIHLAIEGTQFLSPYLVSPFLGCVGAVSVPRMTHRAGIDTQPTQDDNPAAAIVADM